MNILWWSYILLFFLSNSVKSALRKKLEGDFLGCLLEVFVFRVC